MMNERVKTIVDEFKPKKEEVAPVTQETTVPKLGIVEAELLNVRATHEVDPDNILGTIKKDEEVMIDIDESTDEFYKIYTAKGLEGFCMKQFIRVEP